MDKADGSGNFSSGTNRPRPPSETTTVNFEQPDTLVGQRLDGRFLIDKNLTDSGADAGGIGVVYLAEDTKLMGKKVVVKILQESALIHGDIVRKFLHEKEALIRLDHPGIVRILDSGTLTDGNPFMVMEFIEGYSLRKALRTSEKLPLDRAAHLIESMTDALAAAHSKNILHRDIKPENIMLTPQEDGYDRVRLIDFGIARVGESQLAPATEISRAIGTILYIAPEQLVGRLDIAGTADIYAAAIVAYEMLTGELPFKPKSIAEMYQLEKDGVKIAPRQLRHDLPVAAEKLILSALEFEPEKRPQNARSFGRDLGRALRNQGRTADKRLSNEPDVDSSDWKTEVVEIAAPTDLTTVKRLSGQGVLPSPGKKPNRMLWVALGLLLLPVLLLPAGYLLINSNKTNLVGNQANSNTGPADSGAERAFSYFLMVQKMRASKTFEEPFKSSGQEVYESGYKFSMAFQPDADGYMYVFNEGKDAQGKTGYYLLFPTPSVNSGSEQVTAGQQILTAQNTFDGGKGTEVMWLIWTKDKREELEAVARLAVTTPHGAVKDETNAGLLQGFLEKYKIDKAESNKDSANQRTVIKAKGDTVVHRFELEHH